MSLTKRRRQLLETVRWLAERRLYSGTSGNVSCRAPDGFLVTPTGIACDDLRAADMVEVALDGRTRGGLLPSSEWRLHRDIYRHRPGVGAIVHTHSTVATALSCLRRPIPAFHYMIAKTGGRELRCARYATYGTDALSKNALGALTGRRACLLANHGMVALGAESRGRSSPGRGGRGALRAVRGGARARRSRPALGARDGGGGAEVRRLRPEALTALIASAARTTAK